MFSTTGRLSILFIVTCCLLTGCKPPQQPQGSHVSTTTTTTSSTLTSVRKIPAGQQKKPPANPEPEFHGPPRGFLLRGDPTVYPDEQAGPGQPGSGPPQMGQGQEGGPSFPQYSPQRLQAAARLKGWAPTKIKDTGIEIWLKTFWSQGQLNIRVAALGDKEALERLLGARVFHLSFSDEVGNEMQTFDINPADFQWSPPTVNNGTPTVHFESAVESPLETYEQSSNWSWLWDQ